ncbi:MAG: rhomboid family intramembrane serine protease [Pseudomonadota bacterium]
MSVLRDYDNGHQAGEDPDRDAQPERDGARLAREPALNIPSSLLLLAGICIALHVWQTQFLSPLAANSLLSDYALIPARFVSVEGSMPSVAVIKTLVTHSFLHGDWLHLAFNMVWLVAFGAPVAFRLGFGRTLAFWAATAIAAGGLHMLLYWGDPVALIGASGAVSGFLGAAARFGFRRPTTARTGFTQPLLAPGQALRQRGVVPFLVLWMVLNFATGMGWLGGPSNVAWEAHVGGLVAGFLGIGFFDRTPAARINVD